MKRRDKLQQVWMTRLKIMAMMPFISNYGTEITLGGTVTKSWDPSSTLIARLIPNLKGGYLNHYGDYSAAAIECMTDFFYGGWVANNSMDDIQNADLAIFFGNNPAETRMSGGGQTHNYVEGQQKNRTRTDYYRSSLHRYCWWSCKINGYR